MPTKTKQRRLTPAHPIERRFSIVTEMPDSRVRVYRKRVERGASHLDEYQPGWWRHVKTSRLNMRKSAFDQVPDDCGCIGAQLSRYYEPIMGDEMLGINRIIGTYTRWLERIGFLKHKTSRMEVAHGYLASRDDDASAWDLLDQLWANEVRKRREH